MKRFLAFLTALLAIFLIGGCSNLENDPLTPGEIPRFEEQATDEGLFQDLMLDGPMNAAAVTLQTISTKRWLGCSGIDCIPQYSYPEIVSANEASYLTDDDLVLGVVINGTARAYPHSTLWTHEIANDTVGGIRITVNYCPLTGTGLNFKGTIDNEPATFGVSGFLYNNNLILYDHQTKSFWPQMLFTAAWGPQAGKQVELLPIYEMTWKAWKALFPNTTVVSSQYRSPYYPYGNYITDHDHVLFSQDIDSRLNAKDMVMGVIGPATAKAYPFKNMGLRSVINDEIDGEPIVVLFDSESKASAVYKRPILTSGETVEFEIADESAGFPFTIKATGIDGEWNFAGTGVNGYAQDHDLVMVTSAYTGFWLSWGTYYQIIDVYGM